MSKTGLVMEGGAMRGMFTAGVLDVFMEHGITFDGAIGVSAGATFGCNLKSKQPGRAIRYNCKYCGDYRYGSLKSWLKTGNMFDVDFCYRKLPLELDVFDTATFTDNPMDFYVVATDVETGRAVYHKCKDGGEHDIKWIGASATIPIASKITTIGDRKLLDGGISDSIPIKYFQKIGYDKNVIILTRPDTYVKEKNKLIPLNNVWYRKYPNFARMFARRHIMYNKTVEYIRKLEKKGEVFVIRPEAELDIKASESNPYELKRVYKIGRRIGEKRLKEMVDFLNV